LDRPNTTRKANRPVRSAAVTNGAKRRKPNNHIDDRSPLPVNTIDGIAAIIVIVLLVLLFVNKW
jgi:hypothetical protein